MYGDRLGGIALPCVIKKAIEGAVSHFPTNSLSKKRVLEISNEISVIYCLYLTDKIIEKIE